MNIWRVSVRVTVMGVTLWYLTMNYLPIVEVKAIDLKCFDISFAPRFFSNALQSSYLPQGSQGHLRPNISGEV